MGDTLAGPSFEAPVAPTSPPESVEAQPAHHDDLSPPLSATEVSHLPAEATDADTQPPTAPEEIEAEKIYTHALADGREFSGTREQARKLCPVIGKMSVEDEQATFNDADLAQRIAARGREKRLAREQAATDKPEPAKDNDPATTRQSDRKVEAKSAIATNGNNPTKSKDTPTNEHTAKIVADSLRDTTPEPVQAKKPEIQTVTNDNNKNDSPIETPTHDIRSQEMIAQEVRRRIEVAVADADLRSRLVQQNTLSSTIASGRAEPSEVKPKPPESKIQHNDIAKPAPIAEEVPLPLTNTAREKPAIAKNFIEGELIDIVRPIIAASNAEPREVKPETPKPAKPPESKVYFAEATTKPTSIVEAVQEVQAPRVITTPQEIVTDTETLEVGDAMFVDIEPIYQPEAQSEAEPAFDFDLLAAELELQDLLAKIANEYGEAASDTISAEITDTLISTEPAIDTQASLLDAGPNLVQEAEAAFDMTIPGSEATGNSDKKPDIKPTYYQGELTAYIQTLDPTRADTARTALKALLETLHDRQEFEVDLEDGETTLAQPTVEQERLFVQLLESLGLDYADEEARKLVQGMIIPASLSENTDEAQLSIEQLNDMGTREYKPASLAYFFTSLVKMIKQKAQQHLQIGKYALFFSTSLSD